MASSISAGTTSSTALVATADTSGILAIQSNNGVTGLTLNASQALGVGSTPSFGTSGQLLTSAGSGAPPTWSTVSSSRLLRITRYTTAGSGTWTKPSDTVSVLIWTIAGGGGGAGGSSGVFAGGGGSSGGYAQIFIRLALAVLLERVIQREAQEALPLLLVSLEALALLATQEALVMVVVVESAQHPLAGA